MLAYDPFLQFLFYDHIFLVNCVWDDYGEWTSCSKPCGGGQQSRTRRIKIEADNGGKECIGSVTDTKECNTQECIGNYLIDLLLSFIQLKIYRYMT